MQAQEHCQHVIQKLKNILSSAGYNSEKEKIDLQERLKQTEMLQEKLYKIGKEQNEKFYMHLRD